tara:strand:- start:686 stop:1246 length:561 start_codon:yes stop_codon:yes gene_type:complete
MRILFIIVILFCQSSFAGPLENIEKKVNATTSWQSDFIQTTNGQAVEQGKLYVEKPGKLRFIYKNAPYTIYADGTNLIYYDENIDQPTYMEIDQTPAMLLLKDSLKFIDIGLIKKITTTEKNIQIEIDLPDGSLINLSFDAKSYFLNGWVIKDFQGNVINVSLSNIKVDQPINKGLFEFKRKRFLN